MKKFIGLGSLVLGSILLLSSCGTTVSQIGKYDALETTWPYGILRDADFNNAYNEFAADISDIANEGDGNTCISPLSIFSALTMLTFSTDGNTKNEILNYMGMSEETLKNSYNKLFEASNYYDERLEDYRELLNNSIWVQNDFDYKKEGIDYVSKNASADIFKIDFKDNGANDYISDYIKEKTHDLIDRDFGISNDTKLALINTLYLNDSWLKFGDEISVTKDLISFWNTDNTKKVDNFLIRSTAGKAFSNDEIRAMSVYTYNNYKITFIVPLDGYKIKDVFNTENISAAINTNYDEYDTEKYEYTTINKFPMFDAESNISLVDSLKKKGINEVFDKNKADFSPISNTDLYCDSVIHSTKLSVDRKGIIGAAATVVMLGAASPFREEKIKVTEEFIVDRAFGYLVSDSSERVLFSGVINKI